MREGGSLRVVIGVIRVIRVLGVIGAFRVLGVIRDLRVLRANHNAIAIGIFKPQGLLSTHYSLLSPHSSLLPPPSSLLSKIKSELVRNVKERF